MSSTTLNKTETRLLIAAAGREDGRLILPTSMTAATAERLLEKLTKAGLITSREQKRSS
jgi:DNA-binding transcriptional ArsR family regulator